MTKLPRQGSETTADKVTYGDAGIGETSRLANSSAAKELELTAERKAAMEAVELSTGRIA